MIENLKRIREPLAWALVALVGANLVLGIVQLGIALQQAVPLFEAFQAIGSSLMNISLLVAVIALVCTCFFISPATRNAHRLTLVAAWVLTVGFLLTLISYGFGMAAADSAVGKVLEIVGNLLDLVLKAIAAGALWVLLRGVNAGRIDTAAPALPAPVEPADAELAAAAAPEPRTSWQRGEATGAAWRTADEAASGAPGATRLPRDPAGGIFRDDAPADDASSPRDGDPRT